MIEGVNHFLTMLFVEDTPCNSSVKPRPRGIGQKHNFAIPSNAKEMWGENHNDAK
jgi:hypothetical protein